MHTFRDLATAAYCPRKLYYRRRDPDIAGPPEEVEARRDLAFRYEELLRDDGALADAPIDVTATQYRSRLGQTRARLGDDWEALVDPEGRAVHLAGKDARGVAHKVVGDPPRPSLVFTGGPPDAGVWEPQTVRLVAAAKALAWERERPVETAFAEYPAYGVVRRVALTTRRTAAYRSALRTAAAIDGPPSRADNRSKCAPCEYRDQCGVRTRSLRSLL